MGMRLKLLVGSFLFVLVTSSFTLTALADSPITVTTTIDENDVVPNANCSLREAVASANANTGIGGCTYTFISGDDVVILTDTTYALTLPAALNIASTMVISGAGIDSTLIDGNRNSRNNRIFDISNSGVVTITNLTVANGGNVQYGGGIRNENSTLILNNVVVTNNTVISDGGGIYNYNGSILTMTNSSIISNSAGDDGGGLSNQDATATLDNTIISGNIAGNGMESVGGGISNAAQGGAASLILQNHSQVISNTLSGVGGGGISNSAANGQTATLALYRTIVGGNVATATAVISTTGYGGGIRNGYFHGTINSGTARVTVISSTISGNSAINGGGIGNGTMNTSNTTTTVEVTDSTVSGNTAGGYGIAVGNGGGIANVDGTVTLVNSTVSGNAANGTQIVTQDPSGFGGGIGNNADGITTTILMTNTTVASNTAVTGGAAIANLVNPSAVGINADINLRNTIVAGSCSNGLAGSGLGDYNSLGYNLLSESTCIPEDVNNKDRVDSNLLATLGTLADNGGDTQTHDLLVGNPAIDAGTCVGALAIDQRGENRPNVISAFCDVGAVESDKLGVVDLEIVKTVNTTEFLVGDTITYTLIFTNNGPAALRSAVITDIVPVTVTNVTSTNAGATITATNGYTYSWSVADLAWGDGGIITITGEIDPNLTVGGVITNRAIITSTNPDTNVDDNDDSTTGTVLDRAAIYLPIIVKASP